MSPSAGYMADEGPLTFQLPKKIGILLKRRHVSYDDLCIMKSEIERVEALAEQIQHELARMKAHVNRLSTMARLPSEVLAEIFRFATPHNVDPKKTTQRELLSPFFLGAVCREWREIAWTTPYIWTSVSILISGAKRYPIQLELLQGWLQRAKGLPLTINLDFYVPSAYDGNWSDAAAERNDPASVIKLLLDYSSQWKRIDFCLESSWYHHFEDLGRHFPILESVSLRRERLTREPTWTILDILVSCPKLTDLYLKSFSSSHFALVSWQNLRSIEIACNTAEDTEHILSQTTKVRAVYISDVFRRNWVGNSLDIEADITLPEVKVLVISETSAQDICHLMGRLSLPQIEKLEIATPRPEPDSTIDERFDCIDFRWNFQRWARAWKSTLVSIKIEGVLRETRDLLAGLKYFPSLEVIQIENFGGQPFEALELAGAMVDGSIYFKFVLPPDFVNEPYLPSLRAFKYTGPVHILRAQNLVEALWFRFKHSVPASLVEYLRQEPPDMSKAKKLAHFTIIDPDLSDATLRLNDFVHFELAAPLVKEGFKLDVNLGGMLWMEPTLSD